MRVTPTLGLVERRDAYVKGALQSIIVRQIPGPGGIVASRRGDGGPWIFPFGEARGMRAASDDASFVQDVSYTPFGKATSQGVTPPRPEYTNYQWNGGDALADLGLVHLGARLYDPTIGRFLSRDPLIIPRTASSTNPYAFAFNDPINFTDPSGLSPYDPNGQSNSACATSSGAPCGGSGSSDPTWSVAANIAMLGWELGKMAFGGSDSTSVPRLLETPRAILEQFPGPQVPGVHFAFEAFDWYMDAKDAVFRGINNAVRNAALSLFESADPRNIAKTVFTPWLAAYEGATSTYHGGRLAVSRFSRAIARGDIPGTFELAGELGTYAFMAFGGVRSGLRMGAAGGATRGATRAAPSIARIAPGSLPPVEEASLLRTLGHIDAGTTPTGPLARRWGIPFRNWGGDLPGASGSASPYLEYRVAPPPGTSGAGTLRVVANPQTGEIFYTWTHYGDTGAPAFVQIR